MDPEKQMQPDIAAASRPPSFPDSQGNRAEAANITHKNSFTAWADTVWGLVVHAVLSAGIVTFVVVYMEGRAFNTSQHYATFQDTEGNKTLPFTPTQSDIVTILSSMLVIQKWALTAWVASLSWRAAVLLMEEPGLRRHDLKTLIKYRLLSPRAYFESLPSFIISTLLLASLAASLSSPILTGSITWVPTNHPLRDRLYPGWVAFPEFDNSSLSFHYLNNSEQRDFLAQQGGGLVNVGWGRATDGNIQKRVSTSSAVAQLPVGSILENVTLPYFTVDSIKWIENGAELPAYAKDVTDWSAPFNEALSWSPSGVPVYPFGFAALMPSSSNPTNWSSDSLVSRTIEETRLLVLMLRLRDSEFNETITGALPPTAYTLDYVGADNGTTLAYAWVTFRAGVGKCKGYRCIVLSPSTISTIPGDTPLDLEPHKLTFQALSMALPISSLLVNQNSSIPYPWNDINNYIEGLLIRSYSGAWSALIEFLGQLSTVSNYFPALLMLVPQVDHGRVYGWLGLQLLVTLLGISFLVLQSNSTKFPLIGDTALTAFYLDTGSVQRKENWDPFKKGTLKIKEDGDRMRIVVSEGLRRSPSKGE